jgi:hypothetical protein
MSFVHTAKKSTLMMCKDRYGCNAPCAMAGVGKNVRGHTGTN